MVDLSEQVAVTTEDLTTWFKLKKQLAEVKGAEAMLRGRIFKYFFPNPTEGAKDNKHPLNDGTGAVLCADHVINRSVDEQQLEGLREAIAAEGSNLPQLDLTKLIRWKPELVLSEYRKLTEVERHAFDQCLVIKPGSPQLDITIPKRPA
jgi:hypothetical protein